MLRLQLTVRPVINLLKGELKFLVHVCLHGL